MVQMDAKFCAVVVATSFRKQLKKKNVNASFNGVARSNVKHASPKLKHIFANNCIFK
jgi:hypothetical protein